MKKPIKFILPLLLLFSSCGTVNLKKDTTVILTVESEVTPSVAANYGEGKYENNVYTHHVTSQKDLYIYLSYEGLSTETVYIPAKDMNESVIRKTVKFGSPLKSIVTINADNIEDISKATLETETEVLATRYDENNKNIMKVTLSGRDKDIDLTLKADGYKDTKIHVDKSFLKSGLYTARPIFLREGQVAVSVLNANATIYEYPSGQKIRDVYSYNQTTNYIIKDTTKQYYVKYYDSVDGITQVRMVDSKEGFSIEMPMSQSNNQEYLGDFQVVYKQGDNIEYLDKYFVDMKNQTLYPSWALYAEHLKGGFGLIFSRWYFDNESGISYRRLYYIPELAKVNLERKTEEGRGTYYILNVTDLSEYETIHSEVKEYDVLHKERLLRTVNDEIYYNGNFRTFDYDEETKTIKYSFYKFDNESKVSFDIKNEKGEFLMHYEGTLDNLSIQKDLIISKKTRNVRIDLVLDVLEYDEETNNYTYPDVVVDTSIDYIRAYSMNPQMSGYLGLSSVYDLDDHKEIRIKDEQYFQAVAGHRYSISGWENSYVVTVTENDIQCGIVVVGGQAKDIELVASNGWSVGPDPKNTSYGIVYYETVDGKFFVRKLNNDSSFNLSLLVTKGDTELICNQWIENVSTVEKVTVDPVFRSWCETDEINHFGSLYVEIGENEWGGRETRQSYYWFEKTSITPETVIGSVNSSDYTTSIEILESDYIYLEEYGCKVLNPAKYRYVYFKGLSSYTLNIENKVYGSCWMGNKYFSIMKADEPFLVNGIGEKVLNVLDDLFIQIDGTSHTEEPSWEIVIDTFEMTPIAWSDIPRYQSW